MEPIEHDDTLATREDDVPIDGPTGESPQALLERIISDLSCRTVIAAVFAADIQLANTVSPNRWATTIGNQRHIRLVVGPYTVAEIGKDYLWLAVDLRDVTPEALPRLQQLHRWGQQYFRHQSGIAAGYIRCQELEEVLPLVQAGHARFVTACAQQASAVRPSGRTAHNNAIVTMIGALTEQDMPYPDYQVERSAVQNAIPAVERADIEAAFTRFDQERRALPEWAGWETNSNHKYAVSWNSQYYPVKEIVRLATGATRFISVQARSYLQRYGFEITLLRSEQSGAWLFQANPRFYDLADRLRQAAVGDEDVWTVTRYGDRMREDDPVLLWLSGEEAGIYAVGELLGPPTERTYAPGEAPPWLARENANQPVTIAQVPFRYTQILTTPIKRTELQEHPILGQLQVILQPNATNFHLTEEEWLALQELLPAPDGSQRMALATPEGRRAAFARFRDDPSNRFLVAVRQARARQLRALLAEPEALTLEQFNREVWRIESATMLDGQKVEPGITDSRTIEADELEQLEAALQSGRLELHGNYIWRAASHTYHPHSKDEGAKLADIRRAAAILADASLPPLEQAYRVDALPGFGDNTATGLVMVFHPDAFALYNRQSREGLLKLGITVGGLEDFQEQVAALREELGADDCDGPRKLARSM